MPNAGKVSHKDAEKHALAEYEKFRVSEVKRLEESGDVLDKAIKKLTARAEKKSVSDA